MIHTGCCHNGMKSSTYQESINPHSTINAALFCSAAQLFYKQLQNKCSWCFRSVLQGKHTWQQSGYLPSTRLCRGVVMPLHALGVIYLLLGSNMNCRPEEETSWPWYQQLRCGDAKMWDARVHCLWTTNVCVSILNMRRLSSVQVSWAF